MKRGGSPIKTKILSDFFQKISNKKDDKAENIQATTQMNDSVKQNSLKMTDSLKRTDSLKQRTIERKTSNSGQNGSKSYSLSQNVDDILGWGKPVIARSRYAQNNIDKKGQIQKQKVETMQEIETGKFITLQTEKKPSTQQLVVNNSANHISGKKIEFEEYIPSLKCIQKDDKQYKAKIQQLQIDLREKIGELESLQKEKSFFVEKMQSLQREKNILSEKVNKLQQDLSRKEKQLGRRVSEVNSSNLEKQVVLNFMINLTEKIEEFMQPKQDIVEVQVSNSKSLNRSYNGGRSLNTQDRTSNKGRLNKGSTSSMSLSKNKPQHLSLESISETKEISLIESLNAKTLDELTKSMQKGLSKSEVSKQSERLVGSLKKFIQEIKASEEHIIKNLRAEGGRVEKQFQNQKQAIGKVERLYEAEKSKNARLTENEAFLTDKLQKLEEEHRKCNMTEDQFKRQIDGINKQLQKAKKQLEGVKKQLQECKKNLQTSKDEGISKDKRIRQIQSIVKSKEEEILSADRQRQQLIKKQLKQKQQSWSNINKQLQKQLTTSNKQIESQVIKIENLEQQLASSQTKITSLQQLLQQQRKSLKQQSTELASAKDLLSRQERQQEKYEDSSEKKEERIRALQVQLGNKEKKITELEFVRKDQEGELARLREETKQQEIKGVKSAATLNQLTAKVAKLQLQNTTLLQQSKGYQQLLTKTQAQLSSSLKSTTRLSLSTQKQLHLLTTQNQFLQQHNTKLLQQLRSLQLSCQQLTNSQDLHAYQVSQQKSKEVTELFKRMNESSMARLVQVVESREKLVREEMVVLQIKYQDLREEHWKLKEINKNLQEELKVEQSQNQQSTLKVNLFNQALNIISKRLAHLEPPSYNSETSNNSHLSQQSLMISPELLKQIEQNLYKEHFQFFHQLKLLRPKDKQVISIMKHIEILKNTFQHQKSSKVILNQQKQLLQVKVQQFSSYRQQANTVTQIILNTLSKSNQEQAQPLNLIQQLINVLTNTNHSSNFIKHSSLTDHSQLSINSTFITLLDHIKNLIIKENIIAQSQHQAQRRKLLLSYQVQKEHLQQENLQISQAISQVKLQCQHKIQAIRRQSEEQSLLSQSQLHQSIQILTQSHQKHIQSLISDHQMALSQHLQSRSALQVQVTSLSHEISYLKDQNKKLSTQLKQTILQLNTQKETKAKYQSQVNSLKQEIYQLSEFQNKTLNQRCSQLQTQLMKKSQELKHLYARFQANLTQN